MMFRPAEKKDLPKTATNGYQIEIEKEKEATALAPAFKVTMDQSTINSDFTEFAAKFKYGRKNGVNFILRDGITLIVSITPQKPFADGDQLFRHALGLANRHRLTSADLEKIIRTYETYLAENKLESEFVVKKAKHQQNVRFGGAVY